MAEFSKRECRDVRSRTDVSLRSIGAIKTEEFSSTSSETQNTEKYNTSMYESSALRQFEHVSWKYKNPYSVSFSSLHYEKSNHISSKHSQLSLILIQILLNK